MVAMVRLLLRLGGGVAAAYCCGWPGSGTRARHPIGRNCGWTHSGLRTCRGRERSRLRRALGSTKSNAGHIWAAFWNAVTPARRMEMGSVGLLGAALVDGPQLLEFGLDQALVFDGLVVDVCELGGHETVRCGGRWRDLKRR